MPRFFIDAALETGALIQLPTDLVRHIHVLRLVEGESITLFNGSGGEFPAALLELGKRSATARIGAESHPSVEPPYRITLAQGVAGGDKMDWLIEKAVELGVGAIAPLITARGVVRLNAERRERRHAHWLALTRAACEQCGRNWVPEIEVPVDLSKFLEFPFEDVSARYMLSPRATMSFHDLPTQRPSGRVVLMIGPEAGLSEDEEELASSHGFVPLNLGPRILRTETAGIALLAALAGRWGGFQGDRSGTP
jgi:16S rRNA (uracil1498-N3)-methyltransferase